MCDVPDHALCPHFVEPGDRRTGRFPAGCVDSGRCGNTSSGPIDLDLTQDDFPIGLVVGHRQVTDAYLLGLAIARKVQLVTLDRAIFDLLPAASPHRHRVVLLTE
jgi:hypothetical protein